MKGSTILATAALIVSAVMTAGSLAGAVQVYAPQPSASDTFVLTSISGGRNEVAIAKMAAEKASSKAVKEYAQMIERDHTKLNQELEKYAASHNISVPKQATPVVPIAPELVGKTGAQFDKAFIRLMIQDHQKGIDNFEKQLAAKPDADLKGIIERALATMRHHLERAIELNKTLT